MWVGQRVSDSGLSGQVNNTIEALSSEKSFQILPVGYVGPDETKPGSRRELAEAGALQIHVIVGVQAIQAEHLLAIVKKPLSDVIPNKSRRASYENLLEAG